MSCWATTAIPILRTLINDPTGSTYTDSQLIDIFLSSAYLIKSDVDLVNSYTVNFNNKSISPDPSDDTAFMNLMILKSASIIALGEYKLSVSQGVRITDGPSTIDLTTKTETSKKLYDDMKKAYDDAVRDYAFGVNNPGVAILSPYTVER